MVFGFLTSIDTFNILSDTSTYISSPGGQVLEEHKAGADEPKFQAHLVQVNVLERVIHSALVAR